MPQIKKLGEQNMSDPDKFKLRATGRIATGQKVACLMWISEEMVTIDGEIARLDPLDSFKIEAIRTMERFAKEPVALEAMKVAKVMEQEFIVTEADLLTGEFEGMAVGDAYTDEITLESYPVDL